MVIHGTGYRRAEYVPTSVWRRIRPIAIHEFRSLFRRLPGVILFLLCLSPSIVNLFLLMVRSGVWEFGDAATMRMGGTRFDPSERGFYLIPVLDESYIAMIVLTALVGCRAIAKDRAARALELYWTRGITPLAYFVGKWMGSFLLLSVPCVLAPLVVWIFAILMAPDLDLLWTTVGFMPQVLLGLAVYAALLAYLSVAFSAIAATPAFASILWVFLLAVTTGFGRVLTRVFRGDAEWQAINPIDAGRRLARAIASEVQPMDYPLGPALLGLGVIALPLTVLMLRRMRISEAVA